MDLRTRGGALTYLTWRISLGRFILSDDEKTVPQGVSYCLKRLFYNTGLSVNPYVFRTLQELVNPEQILLGTDYPFALEAIMTETVKGLHAYDGFSEDELKNIESENAFRPFPRLGDSLSGTMI
ncbi:hypothetical protein EG833_03240 [archaeon]|nr:hypothetical protein [archaeon]